MRQSPDQGATARHRPVRPHLRSSPGDRPRALDLRPGGRHLPADAPRRRRPGGGFYSEGEFDLSPPLAQPGECLELGRSCVDPDYRSRAVIDRLWSGIADYVQERGIGLMFGCASWSGTRPDDLAALLAYLHHHHLPPPDCRPRAVPARYVDMRRLPPEQVEPRAAWAALPPLLKGYLRLGATIGDGAVVDHQVQHDRRLRGPADRAGERALPPALLRPARCRRRCQTTRAGSSRPPVHRISASARELASRWSCIVASPRQAAWRASRRRQPDPVRRGHQHRRRQAAAVQDLAVRRARPAGPRGAGRDPAGHDRLYPVPRRPRDRACAPPLLRLVRRHGAGTAPLVGTRPARSRGRAPLSRPVPGRAFASRKALAGHAERQVADGLALNTRRMRSAGAFRPPASTSCDRARAPPAGAKQE